MLMRMMKSCFKNFLLSLLLILTNNIIINMYTNALNSLPMTTQITQLKQLQLPKLRSFIPIPHSTSISTTNLKIHGNLRVLQFNILADGLFGLRDDLGAFSRTQKEDVSWSRRKIQLLHEITQYNPDIITLQECDHYYDTFLPELAAKGYDGLFAPKPASACLEVSDNFDGCAIFINRNKLRIVSSETITFALSKADLAINGKAEITNVDDTKIKAQNQVGLIAVCRLLAGGPPIVVATTHLKAAKNAMGENYRYVEIMQLLTGIEKLINNLSMHDKTSTPAILLTGDLNASPTDGTGYTPLAYSAVKAHPLDLRSVMNDDYEPLVLQKNEDIKEKVWTTWKARRKHGVESVTKHCIDYILYNRPIDKSSNSNSRPGFRPISALELFKTEEIGENLLPSSVYPSDHVAIAADLQLVSYEKPPGIDLLENIIR